MFRANVLNKCGVGSTYGRDFTNRIMGLIGNDLPSYRIFLALSDAGDLSKQSKRYRIKQGGGGRTPIETKHTRGEENDIFVWL